MADLGWCLARKYRIGLEVEARMPKTCTAA
jgi:hypothetical protein